MDQPALRDVRVVVESEKSSPDETLDLVQSILMEPSWEIIPNIEKDAFEALDRMVRDAERRGFNDAICKLNKSTLPDRNYIALYIACYNIGYARGSFLIEEREIHDVSKEINGVEIRLDQKLGLKKPCTEIKPNEGAQKVFSESEPILEKTMNKQSGPEKKSFWQRCGVTIGTGVVCLVVGGIIGLGISQKRMMQYKNIPTSDKSK